MKRRILLQSMASLGLGSLALQSRAAVDRGSLEKSTILVGQSAPLTGLSSALGQEMREGIQAHFNAVNKAGGVNGSRLVLKTLDDGYDPARAEANTRQLVSEGAFALLGFVGTPTSLAALKVVKESPLPFFGPYSGSDQLRSPFNPWVFNCRASYEDEAPALVRLLAGMGANAKIALFIQNDSYGQSVKKAVEDALRAQGNPMPMVVATVERNSLDVAAAVDAIARSGAQAVIMGTVYSAGVALQQGLKARGSFPMLASVSFGGTSHPTTSGIIFSQVMPMPTSGDKPLTREFAQQMDASGFTNRTYTSIEAFIAAKTFATGLKLAGANPTREGLVNALETHGPIDLGGFYQTFSRTNHNGSTWTDVTMAGADGHFVR
jgi:branched-chain amino acid transport system substrate-binding protein